MWHGRARLCRPSARSRAGTVGARRGVRDDSVMRITEYAPLHPHEQPYTLFGPAGLLRALPPLRTVQRGPRRRAARRACCACPAIRRRLVHPLAGPGVRPRRIDGSMSHARGPTPPQPPVSRLETSRTGVQEASRTLGLRYATPGHRRGPCSAAPSPGPRRGRVLPPHPQGGRPCGSASAEPPTTPRPSSADRVRRQARLRRST